MASYSSGPLESLDTQPLSQRQVLRIGGFDRTYYVVPPTSATGNPHRPLLLVYHGGGGSATDLLAGTRLAFEGNRAGMVVAFLEAAEGYGARWATSPSDLAVVDDLQFSRAVVDDIAANFPIDRKRVFAAGFSRGGDLVAQIACRAPDMLRAAAAVASTMPVTSRGWCDTTAQSSVQSSIALVIGSQDPLMPWDGGVTGRMAALETATFWGERNGCRNAVPAPQSFPAYSGFRSSRYTLDACTLAEVQLYRVGGGRWAVGGGRGARGEGIVMPAGVAQWRRRAVRWCPGQEALQQQARAAAMAAPCRPG
ncbi:MAG: PHB depolymerase family esterase [Gemmatimonas sp.]